MAKKKKVVKAKKAAGKGEGRGTGSFTDMGRVKALVALMAESGLTEIELAEDGGGNRIILRKGVVTGGAGAAVHHVHAGPAVAHAPAAPAAKGEEEGLIAIKSPMVGTFYAAPNPESDPYVSVGAEVEKDKTVVCVIEAMKVFNEIHADATGTIVKVMVANGQAVEFGQPLFLVRPN